MQSAMINGFLLSTKLSLSLLNLILHLLLYLVHLLFKFFVFEHDGGYMLLYDVLLRVVFGRDWANTNCLLGLLIHFLSRIDC